MLGFELSILGATISVFFEERNEHLEQTKTCRVKHFQQIQIDSSISSLCVNLPRGRVHKLSLEVEREVRSAARYLGPNVLVCSPTQINVRFKTMACFLSPPPPTSAPPYFPLPSPSVFRVCVLLMSGVCSPRDCGL